MVKAVKAVKIRALDLDGAVGQRVEQLERAEITCARERDVDLAGCKSVADLYLDRVQCQALGLVYSQSPSQCNRHLDLRPRKGGGGGGAWCGAARVHIVGRHGCIYCGARGKPGSTVRVRRKQTRRGAAR